MRIAYLGNFTVPWCTEVHVAASLESLGHEVERIQEGATAPSLVSARATGCDLFLWTQTYGLAEQGGSVAERARMLYDLRSSGVPSVAFHLDRWWELEREDQVLTEPFFRCDWVFTADGGHPDRWEWAGVNHRWSPPAIFHEEARGGSFSTEFQSEIAFVGAWRDYGHSEWTHRPALIEHLRTRWDARLWPEDPSRPIRGSDLADLYASTKIVVGDSCLVGGASRYFSDRIPETIGRRGFLLHPEVGGLEECFVDGKHLRTFPLWDFDHLDYLIEHYLREEDERRAIAEQGQAHVQEHHTYARRMQTVLETVL